MTLITQLEQAVEGSRELDTEIALVFGYLHPKRGPIANAPSSDDPRVIAAAWQVPHFSTSLDAAISLIPEGAVWHVMTDYGDLNRAKVGPANNPSASIYGPRSEDFISADASTPALAVCLCALKARGLGL